MDTRTCDICDRPAVAICPRCNRPCCAEHRVERDHSWPEEAYDSRELCTMCTDSLSRSSRAVGRVIVASSAGVMGAALSALLVLMVGSPLGLGTDLTILTMLIAELFGGGGAAYLADRQMQRWFLKRDKRELPGLPEARLLTRGSDE